MKGIEEAKMTPAQKRKDTRLKKKYDKSDMKKSMQKQYGKEEGKKVYFATIRKQAMKEGIGDFVKGLVSKPKPTEYKRMYHGTSSDRAQNIMDKGLKGSRTSVTKTPGVVNTQGSLLKRDAFCN